ncbi:prolactin-releasing peptide [Apteryx mantelli]|uniref:Prolactin-releasing peptide n=1 Tax=Apteryx mantelli TaxID=2696672 RepID=A0ABM4EPH6_9AVES
MKLAAACLVCLLLACLAPRAAEGRLQQHSMEIRNPDIDPSWYTGRGIRPVGRFGRRRALGEGVPAAGSGWRPGCVPPHRHPEPPPQEEPSA